MNHRKLLACLISFAVSELTLVNAFGEGWSISAGLVTRRGMEVNVGGSSYVQTMGIHSATPYRHIPDPVDPDPAFHHNYPRVDISHFADRSFDDGFVFMDTATVYDDLTWYWGYDHGSQYDPHNNTLTFTAGSGAEVTGHRAVSKAYGEEVSVRTIVDEELDLDDKMNGAGVGITVGFNLKNSESLVIELCAGLKGFWGAESTIESSTYAEEVQKDKILVTDNYLYTDTVEYRDTYVYDTTGVIPPPAPYQGTYDGPGTLIPENPMSHEREVARESRDTRVERETDVVSSEIWTAANWMKFDVDSTIYDLWLGPKISMLLEKKVGLFVIPCISMNYVEVDATRSENFTVFYADGTSRTLNEWQDDVCEAEWLFGVGITAGIEVEFAKDWKAGMFGGYDWVPSEAEIQVGPNTVKVDASGYELGVQVTKAF